MITCTAKIRVVEKSGWFWRAIDIALRIVTIGRMTTFLTDYVTTIGPVVAHPVGKPPSNSTLIHEFVHVDQFAVAGLGNAWLGIIPMAVGYLLLPLPIGFAWVRWRLEVQAYGKELEWRIDQGLTAFPHAVGWAQAHAAILCGPAYAWPMMGDAMRNATARKILKVAGVSA